MFLQRYLIQFVGRTVTARNPFFAVELELKFKQPSNMIKQTIDSYVTTDTIFSHTFCFPTQMEQTAVIGYAGKNPSQRF